MAQDTAYRVLLAFTQIHRLHMKSLPQWGLTPGEVRLLRNIMQMDSGLGVMVSELSGVLNVSSSFITQTVNKLVKQGMVDRSADSKDRRIVRLRVTKAGKDLVQDIFNEILASYGGLVEHLGQDKSEELVVLLNKVYEYFDLVAGGKNSD